MFKAIVLACVIGAPTDCTEYHSFIYSKSRDECKNRALTMARHIGEIANLMPKQWRCQPLKEGQLTWNQSPPPLLELRLSNKA
jgi:hypothetical protein